MARILFFVVTCLCLSPVLRAADAVPPGFTAVGDWAAGIPGADPEIPTRIASKDGAYCIYNPALAAPAPVTISIYRVSETGSASTQRYEVHHNGVTDTVDVEFNGVTGWHTLGTFPFAGRGDEYLKLVKTPTSRPRTAEVKFTIRSDDGQRPLRSIVIAPGTPPRLPAPPADDPRKPREKVTLPPATQPAPAPVNALQLPGHISDGMVIQRDVPIGLTGQAPAGAVVTATLNRQTASTKVKEGPFKLTLPAMSAGGPYDLLIRCGDEERTIRNVMIGDLWVVAGQSNMAFATSGLVDAQDVLADADYPDIRFFKQNGGGPPTPQSPARWVACSRTEAARFTAVGFLYARAVHKDRKVPVGLMYAWRDGGDIRLFMRDSALADLTPDIPFKPPAKPRSTLFSDFLAPLVGYPICGMVYYQGEGNQKEPLFYRRLLPAMVKDVRELWGQGDFPFITIQLPRYKDGFVGIREAQFLAQKSIPNSAMVVSIDTGDANLLHPGDKRLIGERAAKAALGLHYKTPGESTGPMFERATIDGNSMLIRFTHTGAGLEARGEMDGFVLCGESGEFGPAKAAIIAPDAVRIWRDDVAKPVAVRYLWSGAPRACLYNREGFPASPFRTDTDADPRLFDNADPGFSARGEWRTVKGSSAFASASLIAPDTRDTEGECDWRPWAKCNLEVARSGTYAIYLRWPRDLPATASIRVEPQCGGYAYPVVHIDQSKGGGEWHKIGEYPLDYGNSDALKLIATGAGAAADAVKIVFEKE